MELNREWRGILTLFLTHTPQFSELLNTKSGDSIIFEGLEDVTTEITGLSSSIGSIWEAGSCGWKIPSGCSGSSHRDLWMRFPEITLTGLWLRSRVIFYNPDLCLFFMLMWSKANVDYNLEHNGHLKIIDRGKKGSNSFNL